MMKLYADMTELSERDVSAKALKRLRISALVSLPLTPLMAVMTLNMDLMSSNVWMNYFSTSLSILAFFISLIAMTILVFSKLLNRVWVRDKYLDEWELQMKHRTLAFVLQVMVWTTAILLGAGVFLDISGLVILPEFSPMVITYGLFSLLMLSIYSQVFVQIAIVQPMEEDEMDPQIDARRPIKGAFAMVGILAAIFVILPIAFGLTLDLPAGSEVSTLSKEAKVTCEARGSGVHWVSIAEDNYGFACFDENRPSPIGTETE